MATGFVCKETEIMQILDVAEMIGLHPYLHPVVSIAFVIFDTISASSIE